jgi:2-polyprenyl-3-methyl-5-hydroxy-6-metoxy-1,4-benzoquinol methylase
MYYTSQGPLSLQNVLGVPAETALKEFEKKLRNRLRDACLTFATATKRHVCRAERIYASFKLPYLSVRPEEAQRNSKIRLENFGIREETLQRKRILDLGSNIGGMLFEIQKYKPAECIGVEYDADKVSLATQIARYNGLENVEFLQADIDCLNPESFGKPFDVVFCLAVESHVNKPMKLFRLLSQLTRGVLYFEGNSNSDTQNIVRLLSQQGFVEVEPLGFGTDDCIPRNNRRPMFRAKKL